MCRGTHSLGRQIPRAIRRIPFMLSRRRRSVIKEWKQVQLPEQWVIIGIASRGACLRASQPRFESRRLFSLSSPSSRLLASISCTMGFSCTKIYEEVLSNILFIVTLERTILYQMTKEHTISIHSIDMYINRKVNWSVIHVPFRENRIFIQCIQVLRSAVKRCS